MELIERIGNENIFKKDKSKGRLIMKKLIIFTLFSISMATFGIGIKGISQKGDYCVFKDSPKISTLPILYEATANEYIIYDAKCVINQLDFYIPNRKLDFHYQSYGGKIFDVEMLFLNLEKNIDISKVRRIEFGEGLEIVGSGHTGRLSIGKVTEYSVSGDTIKILGNSNNFYK